jgi:GNAT superfamily N-acetyltransferase
MTVNADIRAYRDEDAGPVGVLIAETYSACNLQFASLAQLPALLGPFAQAHSADPVHQAAIAAAIRSQWVWVAQAGGELVGVLRGREGRLGSLFVRLDHQRQGIGRLLVDHFEGVSQACGVTQIKVAATLEAIGFYERVGYKKTTGARRGHSFEGEGLLWQPMAKRLLISLHDLRARSPEEQT